jgi:dipeptidyl aminopeptidase/acylaminoacyl peptidase
VRTLKIPRGVFNAVRYTADGEHLVGLHSGWRLRVWATEDFRERYAAALPGYRHAHGSLGLAGELAVLSQGVYDLTDLWAALRSERGRVNDPALIRAVTLRELESRFAYVTYATDGRVIVRAHWDYPARKAELGFWDQARLVRSLALPCDRHPAPVLSPDGGAMAMFSGPHLRLYHRNSGEEVASLGHTDAVNGALFSPDGKQLAVAAGRSLWLWDLASKEGERFPAFDTFVEGLAYSPDGSRLAAADRTGEIRLLEAASRRQLGCLNFAVGAIHDLAFSPDGMTVAGAARDNAVVVWDLE